MVFSSNLIWQLLSGGVLAWSMALQGGGALANTSLPLDIDLTSTDAEEDVAEPAPDAEDDASAPESAPVVPLEPPPPLRPTTNVSEDLPIGEQPTPVEDNLPTLSDPTGPMPPAETRPSDVSPQDMATFLIGQDTETAIAMLEQDGWVVVAQTPGLVQLDRGQMGLDLEVDNTTGKVIGIDLIDLT
jgi:hypothetical protein